MNSFWKKWKSATPPRQWSSLLALVAFVGAIGYAVWRLLATPQGPGLAMTPRTAPGSQYSRTLNIKGGKYQFKGGFRVNLTRGAKKDKPEAKKPIAPAPTP